RDTPLGPTILPTTTTYAYNLPNDTVPLPTDAGGKALMFGYLRWPGASGRRVILGPVELGHSATSLLHADAGGFVVTGRAAGMGAGRRVGAARGTFTFTGQTATFYRGRMLTAGGGVVALNGRAVSFRIGRALVAGAGAFHLSGQPASMVATTLMLA